MAVQTVGSKIPRENAGDPSFASIFAFWSSIETQIAALRRVGTEPERTALLDQMTDAQSDLIGIMTDKPATSASEVFFKLAIWRFENFGWDAENEDMSRSERLAVSAFDDLTRIVGRNDFVEECFEEIRTR